MKKIDLENHFATEAWLEALRKNKGYPRVDEGGVLWYYPDSWSKIFTSQWHEQLLDLGEGRIREMDAAGVDMAVLSLTAPGVEQLESTVGTKVAQSSNDILAEAIDRHPERFAGFAALYPKDVASATRELERCVKELNLVGWNTHCNFGDSYIDEKAYWPILAKAEELGVPIYIHPTCPMIMELRTFGTIISGSNFGFGTETAFVVLRMIARGVFDAFPRLKVILGHYGEGLPFMLNRVDSAHRQDCPYINAAIGPGSEHWMSYYLLKNMYVTTSGNYLPAAFFCTRDSIGMDKILLGTDHPYESMAEGLDFLRDLSLSDDEQLRLYEQNAVALGVIGE